MICMKPLLMLSYVSSFSLYIFTYMYLYILNASYGNLWASLVAQMVKNLPVMQETRI